MQKLPKAIRQLIDKFEQLPGIGPKSAQRLVFYLLHYPQHQLEDFADKLVALNQQTVMCSHCHNVDEHDPCTICDDPQRDHQLLCVVEQPLDLLALERSGQYRGLYHVLHGSIAPLNNIGPDQLYLKDLLGRIKSPANKLLIKELILATNPTMEGEATALYISEMIDQDSFLKAQQAAGKLKVTRIGHGLPIGADIEYADGVTLARALEGRRTVN